MNTFRWILCALFAAITAVLSQLSIPIGVVPINLATLSVLLAGGLLGAKFGALSQLLYVMLGIIGIPVFAEFSAGPQIIVGPTGGYIVGYVLGAVVVGYIAAKGDGILVTILAMLSGFVVYMTIGTAWYMISTGNGFVESLTVCVFPFLLGDAAKIALATVLTRRLRPIVARRF